MSTNSLATMLMQPNEDESCRIGDAVTHLVDLGSRMRSSTFGFKEQDVANIDSIIEALNELENQRSVIHDQLEAETIKSSILRHELKHLPQKYRTEIHDAVVNARQSNSDLVTRLNAQIVNIEKSVEDLTARNEQLEADNTYQLPERDRLRVQHEEVITVLNLRMAEKATEQIKLNETRDRLRGTHAKIMDLEDDLLQLKEDMIKERADVRAEKARLRAAINETKEKTAAQNKENEESKSQLDVLLKRLDFTEKELDELRKFLYKADVSKAKAEGQERALNSQINKQLRDNDNLRKDIIELQRRKIETEQKYKSDIEAMQKHVEQLKAQIKAKEQRLEKLKVRRDDLHADAEIITEKRASSQKQVIELTDMMTNYKICGECLNEAKRALVRKQEDIARMREETSRMEQEIVELGDTHLVCVENFNRQIEEYREQLGKERKERMDVQKERDAVQKTLEEFKADNNRFMATVNKKVTQGKEKHETLTHEGADLQTGLRELEDQIKQARVMVREERVNYDLKKSEIEQHLAALQIDSVTSALTLTEIYQMKELYEMGEVKRYETMTSDAKELLEIKVPEFAAQTKAFNEAQVEFDKIKKQVTEMGIEGINLRVEKQGKAETVRVRPKKLSTDRERYLEDLMKLTGGGYSKRRYLVEEFDGTGTIEEQMAKYYMDGGTDSFFGEGGGIDGRFRDVELLEIVQDVHNVKYPTDGVSGQRRSDESVVSGRSEVGSISGVADRVGRNVGHEDSNLGERKKVVDGVGSSILESDEKDPVVAGVRGGSSFYAAHSKAVLHGEVGQATHREENGEAASSSQDGETAQQHGDSEADNGAASQAEGVEATQQGVSETACLEGDGKTTPTVRAERKPGVGGSLIEELDSKAYTDVISIKVSNIASNVLAGSGTSSVAADVNGSASSEAVDADVSAHGSTLKVTSSRGASNSDLVRKFLARSRMASMLREPERKATREDVVGERSSDDDVDDLEASIGRMRSRMNSAVAVTKSTIRWKSNNYSMKSQKASLEDQVKRTRLAVDKAIKPQAELRKELQLHRQTLLDSMKVQLQEAEELERQVYVVGTKLQTIADENQRFTDGNEEMESDLVLLERDLVLCEEDISKLRAEYAFLKSLLVAAWNEDSTLEQQMTERDLDVLQKLADVLKISSKRSGVVEHVSADMNMEVENLSTFLDTVANRRPKVESERVDTATNTRGRDTASTASQPSQHFLEHQKKVDEFGVIEPLADEVSPPTPETSSLTKLTHTSKSKDSPGQGRKLNRKTPLPPIARSSSVSQGVRGSSSTLLLDSTLRDSVAASDVDIDVDT